MAAHHQLSFPVIGTKHAVRETRHRLVAAVSAWDIRLGEERLGGIELVAGELIANAVLHAGAGPITVDIRLDDTELVIAVHDTDPAPPRATPAGPEAESGRGLLLVAEDADRCGTEPTATGKRCWAVFDLSPSSNSEEGAMTPAPAMPTPSTRAIDRFTGPWEFLSNYSAAMVRLDGIEYPTVEHAYQAAKTLDLSIRTRIAGEPDPDEAKRLGRRHADRPDWEEAKVAVMRSLIEQKFQDPELRERLLATGTAELVEGNDWGDEFWGVCAGHGQNTMGLILMALREQARRETSESHEACDARTTDLSGTLGCAAQARIPTAHGMFTAWGYRNVLEGGEQLALTLGRVRDAERVLVRGHSEYLTGEALGSLRCDCGPQLDAAMAAVAAEGVGVILYLRGHEGRGIGLLAKLRLTRSRTPGSTRSTPTPRWVCRRMPVTTGSLPGFWRISVCGRYGCCPTTRTRSRPSPHSASMWPSGCHCWWTPTSTAWSTCARSGTAWVTTCRDCPRRRIWSARSSRRDRATGLPPDERIWRSGPAVGAVRTCPARSTGRGPDAVGHGPPRRAGTAELDRPGQTWRHAPARHALAVLADTNQAAGPVRLLLAERGRRRVLAILGEADVSHPWVVTGWLGWPDTKPIGSQGLRIREALAARSNDYWTLDLAARAVGFGPMDAAHAPPLPWWAGISVVIPARGVHDVLPGVLHALADAAARLPAGTPWEAIVVDDASDPLLSLPSGLPRQVRLVRSDTQLHCGGARNHGMARSRYGLVLFCDADTHLAPDYLTEHVARHLLAPTLITVSLRDHVPAHLPVPARAPDGSRDSRVSAHYKPGRLGLVPVPEPVTVHPIRQTRGFRDFGNG